MQEDFHYYATYCAAFLAGYTHEESQQICYSAQLVDLCSRTFLRKIGGPASAATTQLQLELMDARTDPAGLQDITRIWASFHFLPKDLHAEAPGGKRYRNKFRLICGPNGELTADAVELAKGRGLPAAGLAMHVVADTWAHQYFAGTPSLVINNMGKDLSELVPCDEGGSWKPIKFNHNPGDVDDPSIGKYTSSIYVGSENSIMNLGHGRAGHLPDYSWARYRYMPAWGDYREIIKDNPTDYMNAFCQLIYALKYLRGDISSFETGHYDYDAIAEYKDEIEGMFLKRQIDSSSDWKSFGEKLSGHEIEDFDTNKYQKEYISADEADKDDTFLGKFILAALRQKSMVTNRIFNSGNLVAGISVDFRSKGLKGIKAFFKLVTDSEKDTEKEARDD